MLKLFKKHPDLILFGALTAFFSGPGQTFLVALFIPHMRMEFNISKTEIAALYSAATLISALFLPLLGIMLDRMRLLFFSLGAGFLMLSGCLLLSQSSNLFMIFIGFFLIRNLGQGALTIISSTTMAKCFGSMRGKAISMAYLGFPLSEAMMPFLVSSWILWMGWRTGWMLLAGFTLVIFLPLACLLLRKSPEKEVQGLYDAPSHTGSDVTLEVKHWKLSRVIRDARFYLLLCPILIPPAYVTALFFHQAPLMEWKGWSIQMAALAFMAYGLCRALISLIIGPYVDRYSARVLFPISLIPFGLGILCLWQGSNVIWVFMYLGAVGLSMGLSMTTASALWAEMYGTLHLGSLKGFLSALMVLSTALAPVLMGYCLDVLKDPSLILGIMLVLIIVGTALSSWVCYRNNDF